LDLDVCYKQRMLLTCTSYRDFLSAELVRRVRANPHYSQRAFAKQLGLSPGELSEIFRGKRSLSLKSALKITRALGLNRAESQHLLSLIQHEKLKQTGEETSIPELTHEELSQQQLTLDMFSLVSEWYCFAILNLADCEHFRWDENWISKRLGVSIMEVRVAVQRLLRVGLIEKKKDSYAVTKDYVISPEGIPSEAIRSYHRQILSRAITSLDSQKVEEREITGISFALHPKFIPAIKKDIQIFLDSIASRYGKSKRPQDVFQLELAFFKLSEGDRDAK